MYATRLEMRETRLCFPGPDPPSARLTGAVRGRLPKTCVAAPHSTHSAAVSFWDAILYEGVRDAFQNVRPGERGARAMQTVMEWAMAVGAAAAVCECACVSVSVSVCLFVCMCVRVYVRV